MPEINTNPTTSFFIETVNSPIILMGPTTTGKSEIARELAHTTGGVIINADRFYAFARRGIELGLGLGAGELHDGIHRELYGIREVEQPPLEPDEFAEAVTRTVSGTHELGRIAIIEGCTRRYLETLYQLYGPAHTPRITWQGRNTLPNRIGVRFDSLMEQGLIDETRQGIENGWGDTFPYSSLLYTMAKKIIADDSSRPAVEAEATKTCLDIAYRHDRWYEDNTSSQVFKIGAPLTAGEIADAILQLMQKR